jgi:hypothetical protein
MRQTHSQVRMPIPSDEHYSMRQTHSQLRTPIPPSARWAPSELRSVPIPVTHGGSSFAHSTRTLDWQNRTLVREGMVGTGGVARSRTMESSRSEEVIRSTSNLKGSRLWHGANQWRDRTVRRMYAPSRACSVRVKASPSYASAVAPFLSPWHSLRRVARWIGWRFGDGLCGNSPAG